MAHVYVAGVDFGIIGEHTFTITDDSGGPFTVTLSSGTYAPITMASVSLASGYTSLATAIAAAMTATASTHTYTGAFAYSSTGPRYTFTIDSGSFTLTIPATAAGTRARLLMGFTATTGSAASHTSDQRPYYTLAALQGATAAYNTVNVAGRSDYTGEYEPDGIAVMSTADNGATYMVSRTTVQQYAEWTQRMEAKRSVYSHEAAATIPWTYEHFFAHCRNGNMPFMTVDELASESIVWRLRADGASFHPAREVADHDDLWSVPFRAILQGRI